MKTRNGLIVLGITSAVLAVLWLTRPSKPETGSRLPDAVAQPGAPTAGSHLQQGLLSRFLEASATNEGAAATGISDIQTNPMAAIRLAAASNTAPQPAPPGGKPPIQDALARQALALVGTDQDAEQYWMEAINDPSLSEVERQDLIEDLNEDGLADPRHPTVDDLPVILRRIFIIEQIAPDAMDQVNAEAFAEAYKDLVNLAAVAGGSGNQ